MNIAIIGCGFVADFYMHNLRGHPDFVLSGVYDRDPTRLDAFCRYYAAKPYATLDALLADPSIAMVLNLSNPRSHFEISAAALKAGKHVYTEKPLGLSIGEARTLVELADANNVRIGCAPCSMLSDTAQTLGKAIRDGAVGKVRLVYANYDDGMIAPMEEPWNWRSTSGAAWPAKDEFETGCTYEHAGYVLTWLAAYFGPARSVTAFSSCQIPDKGMPVDLMAPDFSSGCIQYDNGVVARVTLGLVAPEDKSITVVGDEGYISVRHLRNDKHVVRVHRSLYGNRSSHLAMKVLRKARRLASRYHLHNGSRRLPQLDMGRFSKAARGKPVDFFRGPQDMLDSIRKNQPHRLSAELGLHIVEIIEALQYPERFNHHRVIESSFPPVAPM
ncbi:MAG TPA: Gfo/Idh/MocA family oxidoreductase [Rhizomicrobium sp.]|jgi:predicted dehydrogenase